MLTRASFPFGDGGGFDVAKAVDALLARPGIGRYIHTKNSLFALAAASPAARRHMLRDHYRCHPDIAAYLSEAFYGSRLHVPTRETALRPPPGVRPGLHWTDVAGTVEKASSGCHCRAEVEAVVAHGRALLVEQDYVGTIGMVTPFREQAIRLMDALAGAILAERMTRADAGADVLVRLTWNSVRLESPDGPALDWMALFAAAAREGVVDRPVRLRKARGAFAPLALRLVVLRKLPEAAQRAQRTAVRASRKNQHRADERTLAAALSAEAVGAPMPRRFPPEPDARRSASLWRITALIAHALRGAILPPLTLAQVTAIVRCPNAQIREPPRRRFLQTIPCLS